MELEDYVELETRFGSLIWQAWERETKGVVGKANRLIKDGQYDDAVSLISKIDVQLIAQGMAGDIRSMSYASLTFGAMLAKGGTDIMYKKQNVPPVLETVVDFVWRSMDAMVRQIVGSMHLVIQDREIKKDEDSCCQQVADIMKAAKMTLAERLNAVVMDQSRALIDIAANATTTRLVGLGFLDQAQNDGIQEYQITSALDKRVCPVCRTMHGKVFLVAPAHDRLLNILRQSDPALIKSMAPWPSQNKANVKMLRAMEPSQLQSAGLDTTPYHGGCRCRQVLVGTVPANEILAVAEPNKPKTYIQMPVPELEQAMTAEAEGAARSLMAMTDTDILRLKQLNQKFAAIKVTSSEATALTEYRKKPFSDPSKTDAPESKKDLWDDIVAATSREIVPATTYRSLPVNLVARFDKLLNDDAPFDLGDGYAVSATAYKKVSLAHQKLKQSGIMLEISTGLDGVYTSILNGGNADAEFLMAPGQKVVVTKRWEQGGVRWFRLKLF
jgi:SPP1 gp7 family putative phage head morphogenesis protein